MMKMKQDNLFKVRVNRHLMQGLSITLDGGEQGLIRIREISWKPEDIATWREDYPIGWEGFAVPVPLKKGEAREFSLRLVDYDPWDDFIEEINKDQIFEGIVTGVHEYGAFIEIDEGITGLLRKSYIPAAIQGTIPDLFWYNDKVFVKIHSIDHDKRQIELGLAPVGNLSGENPAGLMNQPTGGYEARSNLEEIRRAGIPTYHVLVVEDEASQSEAICNWLRDLGQRVDFVTSAEEALEYLAKSQPHVALVDVGLPGMSGTKLAEHILEKYPNIQVVNATDWARASEEKKELDKLSNRGGKLFYKPIAPEDLVNYLLNNHNPETAITQVEKKIPIDQSKVKYKKAVHKLLAMCRKKLGMELVILFSFDLAHRKVSIIDRLGDGQMDKNAIPQLIHSPVRDVAEDGEGFFLGEIGQRDLKRFQYLLEFSPLTKSCIGVPVPAQSGTKYALLVMDPQVGQFSDETKTYMEGLALAIGATLDQIDIKKHAALVQRSALVGNLASGMIHEINNLLAPLLQESDNLRKSITRAEKDQSAAAYENVKKEVSNIEQDIRQIVSTVKIFGSIAKKSQVELLRVDQIIKDTFILLNQISKRSRVDMYFYPPEKLVLVRNKAVLLEQILLNVCLNAIQQISEHRREGNGAIRVDLEIQKGSDTLSMCRILVRDNGPGIHASLWEKIFEMGYSTRQDGSGIGLFVSRNLMEETEGRIFVKDSHILSGSTFVLEFPVELEGNR